MDRRARRFDEVCWCSPLLAFLSPAVQLVLGPHQSHFPEGGCDNHQRFAAAPIVNSGEPFIPATMARPDAVAGETLSRRAAQHRAARRARAGARGKLHRRSERAAPRPQHLSPLRRQRPRAARRVSHPGRRCPDRPAGDRRGRMAARQLPPGHVGNPGHPPAPARHATTANCRRSPRASKPATRASTRWPSSCCVTTTAGSTASSSPCSSTAISASPH